MLKNILLHFIDLYNMTCVYCRKEDKLSVCIKTTPSCIQKKKLKLYFCMWMQYDDLDPEFSNLPTFPSGYHPTVQLSKMFCNNVPVTVQQFEHNALSPEFPGAAVSSLNSTYWKVLYLFRESIWSLFNSKAASRKPLIIFIVLLVSPTTYWRAWAW